MFKRVLITDPHNKERTFIKNEEDYQIYKDLKKGYFYEILGLPEYQVKPYFDVDGRENFDYKIFDEIEKDLKKIIDVPIYSMGRKAREEDGVIKHSRRYYIKARITFSNIPIVFKELFDKYKGILDDGVYDKNRKMMLPLTNMKLKLKVPQLKLIKGSIFDNCASWIEEDYEDLDLKVPSEIANKIDKWNKEMDIKDDDDENDDNKYKKLQKLIKKFKTERSHEYTSWISMCWCLKNISKKEGICDEKAKRLIHQFSELSSKYDEDDIDKWLEEDFIRDLNNTRQTGYAWNYLYNCIKQDDPDYYFKLTQSYFNVKNEFEKNHCKITFPPSMITINNSEVIIQPIQLARQSFRHIQASIKVDDKKYKNIKFIEKWLDDPQIRIYNKIVFKPPPYQIEENVFNTWIDFKISNQPLIKTERDYYQEWYDFGLNLIGNKSYLDVIVARYAQRFQKPAKRTNICVIYYGEERIGKNRFLAPIQKIMGDYYKELDDASKLYDKHSMYEVQKLLLCVNEAQGIHNFTNADILKARITENTLSVNPKGIQSYEIDNFCDYDMTTNNINVIKLTDSSFKRFFQVECSKYYLDNAEFFNDYIANIEENPIAIRQIYEGLMNFDIKSVIPSGNFQIDKPITNIEIEVKENNKDIMVLFLEDYSRNYMKTKWGSYTIQKYSNQAFFDIWTEWLEKSRISNMEGLTKHKFGIKLSRFAKSNLPIDTFIKDTSNGITKIDTEKLIKHFKMEDIKDDEE
jgi:hypothetical protein